jgi:hypothetical protein
LEDAQQEENPATESDGGNPSTSNDENTGAASAGGALHYQLLI